MQDAEIVALYWERNERAIRETERQYGRYLFQIAHNILREREDSRECVNDTYLRPGIPCLRTCRKLLRALGAEEGPVFLLANYTAMFRLLCRLRRRRR